MALKLVNYQDRRTTHYAQLWTSEPFWVKPWYTQTPLPSQAKSDEQQIGASHVFDVIDACWLFHEGRKEGVPVFQLVASADLEREPPAPGFVPVYPGVNLLVFDAEPKPPEEQPEAPPMLPDRMPSSFCIYGANVCEPIATWWGRDLVFTVPREWYVEAWEMGPKKLLEKLSA